MSILRRELGPRVRFQVPLAPRTTWGLGGPAWALCRVHSAGEAATVIRACRRAGRPWLVLGRGSNLLVRDGGYPGVVLRLSGPLAGLEVRGNRLQAGGGAGLAAAVRLAARRGLAGLEWAVGIPATVGGAVVNNAGAYGADMAGLTRRLTLLDPRGRVEERAGRELPAGYRQRRLPRGWLLLAAELELSRDHPRAVLQRTRQNLARRRASQPLAARTAGSVFKNPPGLYAGGLIEQAGCKGLSRGGARVSPHHANFIENRGRARAREVLALMDEVARRVRETSGVELEPEVEVVGDG